MSDSTVEAGQERTGRCQCGATTYTVTGAPFDPHLCSCPHCSRLAGGPTMLWVGFQTLTWTGAQPSWYATFPTLDRAFCARCGTHLASVAADSPMPAVTVSSLDDREGLEPVGHSFRHLAPPWMTIVLAPDPQLR